MRQILFKGQDNSVAIMTLAEGASESKAVKDFMECHSGFYERLEGNYKLPDSREHRDAWVVKGSKIVVDKSKMRSIEREQLTEK